MKPRIATIEEAFKEGMRNSSIRPVGEGRYVANYTVQRGDGRLATGKFQSDNKVDCQKKLRKVVYCYANCRTCECFFNHLSGK